MRFIKVNYHLNKKFLVEDKAYYDMVNKTIKSIKGVTVEKFSVHCNEPNNTFSIKITVEKKKKNNYFDLSNKLQKELEDKSHLLINTKPENIEINFKEIK